MQLLGLLVLERLLLLCRDIGSTEGDLTSRECKRHQKKKNLIDRGNVCVGERKGDFERRTSPLYTYQIQTPTFESSLSYVSLLAFVSFCCLLSNTLQPYFSLCNLEICSLDISHILARCPLVACHV